MISKEELELNIKVKKENIERFKLIDDVRVQSLLESLRIEVDELERLLNIPEHEKISDYRSID
jgi:hypothetical protein